MAESNSPFLLIYAKVLVFTPFALLSTTAKMKRKQGIWDNYLFWLPIVH